MKNDAVPKNRIEQTPKTTWGILVIIIYRNVRWNWLGKVGNSRLSSEKCKFFHFYLKRMSTSLDFTSKASTALEENRGPLHRQHSFPSKLYAILQEARKRGYQDIIDWQNGGKSFKVHDRTRFSSEVMPRYFKQTQFKSFQRQLHVYGFKRIHHGVQKGGYVHPEFVQDFPLSIYVTRIPSGQTLAKPSMRQETQGFSIGGTTGGLLEACMKKCDSSGSKCNDASSFLRSIGSDARVFPLSHSSSNIIHQIPSLTPPKSLHEDALQPPNNLALNENGNLDKSKDFWDLEAKGRVAFSHTPGDYPHGHERENRCFPWKLFTMLEDAERDKFEDIVSWKMDGAAFRVHDRRAFVEKLMPIYFDQTKYESFRRQLNLYGFTRITTGKNQGVYFHEFFLRCDRSLCWYVERR